MSSRTIKKKVILTGSTGLVGKGVLLECLSSSRIEKILVINRSTLGIKHAKLQEVLLTDFTKIASKSDLLKGYDACFYCLGVTVFGYNEKQYTRIIYDTTVAFVDVLHQINPNLVFNYVSGMGTDSSEQGPVMWARIKGKTENLILQKGFADAYMFRLGIIIPKQGIQSRTQWYRWMYWFLSPFSPLIELLPMVTNTTQFGQAMINTLFYPQERKYLDNLQINKIARLTNSE